MYGDTLPPYSHLRIRAQMAIYVINNIHNITLNIMSQLLAYIRANTIIYMLNLTNSHVKNSLSQMALHFQTTYIHDRKAIVYDRNSTSVTRAFTIYNAR